MNIVVLGVGNIIMGDEGVGVRCVERIEAEHLLPASVVVIDGGTSTNEVMGELEGLDLLVIVDAVVTGAPPGTLVRLEGKEIPTAFSNKLSPHQHGINDLLATLTFMGRAPNRVVLHGVVPHRIELGLELSAELAAVVPALVANVVAEVERAT
jgi:hydrogenase maturation protease